MEAVPSASLPTQYFSNSPEMSFPFVLPRRRVMWMRIRWSLRIQEDEGIERADGPAGSRSRQTVRLSEKAEARCVLPLLPLLRVSVTQSFDPNLNRGIHRTIIDAACFYSKVKALNSVGESRSLPLKMTFSSRLQNNRRWWYILEKILTAISSITSSSSRIPRIQARVCLFSNHLYWLFHISSNFCYPSPTHWRASQLETGSFLGPVTLRLAKCERYNFHFCFRCFFTKVIPEANVIYAIYEVWQESGTNWARNLRWSEDGWVGGSTPFLQPHLLSEPITFYPSLARIHLRRALPGSCPWHSFIPSRRFSPTPRSTYYIYLFNLVSASMSSIPFSLLSIFTASFLHSPQPSRNLTLNRD